MKYVTKDLVSKLLPKRQPWSRKGDFGRLLVVGGSCRYTGAPALAALAALRTGCDLVTVAAPERAANTVASFSPDLITEPFTGNHFNKLHARGVLELAGSADAVVMGGGLGRKRETITFIQNALSSIERPCVLDADALSAVSMNRRMLKQGNVLTPHSREFQSLSGAYPSLGLRERSREAEGLAKSLDCTILLKGHIDVISDGRQTLLNRTGNPYMTKGGTGDVLAGIAGSLMAQGLGPLEAAFSAAFINGRAGALASDELGRGMLASDLLRSVPSALR